MYSFTPNPVVSVGSSVTCDLSLIPFFTLSSAPADTFKAYPFPAHIRPLWTRGSQEYEADRLVY